MSETTPPRPPKPCPVCGKRPAPGTRAAVPFQPFCSARCRQVDLGRWLAGDYAIPSDEELPEEDTH